MSNSTLIGIRDFATVALMKSADIKWTEESKPYVPGIGFYDFIPGDITAEALPFTVAVSGGRLKLIIMSAFKQVKNITSDYELVINDSGTVLEVGANVTITAPVMIGFNCNIIINGDYTVTMDGGANYLGATQFAGDGALCLVTANSTGLLLWTADGLV